METVITLINGLEFYMTGENKTSQPDVLLYLFYFRKSVSIKFSEQEIFQKFLNKEKYISRYFIMLKQTCKIKYAI